jgi:hypothetical protein
VLEDYHRLMNLAGYQDVIARDADTALKINISWHFFFPACSTTPWQLEGVIRAMKRDGYDPNLIHGCHNRTVVIDAHLGNANDGRRRPVRLGQRVLEIVIRVDPRRAVASARRRRIHIDHPLVRPRDPGQHRDKCRTEDGGQPLVEPPA